MTRRNFLTGIIITAGLLVAGLTIADAGQQVVAPKPFQQLPWPPVPDIVPAYMIGHPQGQFIDMAPTVPNNAQHWAIIRYGNGQVVTLKLGADKEIARTQAEAWAAQHYPGSEVGVSPSQDEMEVHMPPQVVPPRP